jgi:hypothetical protein
LELDVTENSNLLSGGIFPQLLYTHDYAVALMVAKKFPGY